ncbi:hypothetical protein VNI00_003732 [Paramarasmius palmivorus]|uniref:Uncharacterized protein n=1 Tax=Paramarasmius palmivorus TaxID=297713 RepID=A0AAW0DRX8_9AGAR
MSKAKTTRKGLGSAVATARQALKGKNTQKKSDPVPQTAADSTADGEATNVTDEPGKTGRKSWAKGRKLVILLKHEKTFYENHSLYYDLVCADFLEEWGHNLRWNEEPDDSKDYTDRPLSEFTGDDLLEEVKNRQKFEKANRDNIAAWARNRFNKKQSDSEKISEVLAMMTEFLKVLPHRTSLIRMYQRIYYQAKLKHLFDAQWTVISQANPNAEWIKEMNKFSASMLASETEEVLDQIKAEIQTEYDERMAEYKKVGRWDNDADKFNYNWKKAHRVVPTLVDSIAAFLGCGVLLTTFGPMADGEISVQSVCAVVPGARTRQTLAQFNKAKLAETHTLCHQYAQALFSESMCRSRIPESGGKLGVAGDEDDDSDAAGAERLDHVANPPVPVNVPVDVNNFDNVPTTSPSTSTNFSTNVASSQNATGPLALAGLATASPALTDPIPGQMIPGFTATSGPIQNQATFDFQAFKEMFNKLDPLDWENMINFPPGAIDPPQNPSHAFDAGQAVPVQEHYIIPRPDDPPLNQENCSPMDSSRLEHPALDNSTVTPTLDCSTITPTLDRSTVTPTLDNSAVPPTLDHSTPTIVPPLKEGVSNHSSLDATDSPPAGDDHVGLTPARKRKLVIAREKATKAAEIPQGEASNGTLTTKKPLTPAEKRRETLARKKAEAEAAAAAAAASGVSVKTGKKRRAATAAENEGGSRSKRPRTMPAALAAGGYKPPAKGKR